MKKILIALVFVSWFCAVAQADVWVDGYYRKDGTYVQGYWRSSPNETKSDNYGPGPGSPYLRDNDGDGIPNHLDNDDDNDRLHDDKDKSKY